MLDIVIPVYNEKDLIGQTLDEICSAVRNPKRIMIIYDFEEDNTLPAVRQWLLNHDADIVMSRNQWGKGVLEAIKTGFLLAIHPMVLVVMADLSDDLSIVDSMIEHMNQGSDIVCGSRYMRGGSQEGGPVLKGLLSRWAGQSLHLLTGIPTHDVSNSFKLYRKSLLDKIKIESTGGFELGMEILVKAYNQGYTISELPSHWKDRTAGESRFKLLQWLPHYLYWYFYAFKKRTKSL